MRAALCIPIVISRGREIGLGYPERSVPEVIPLEGLGHACVERRAYAHYDIA